MKTHVIQLERFDDVISTKDRISWTKAPRVLLVWPRRGRIMRRMPDLVVLDRYCRKLGAQLALVTWDDVVIQQAETLGIPVFESVEKAQSISWRRKSGWSFSSLVRRNMRKKSFQELRKEARTGKTSKSGWLNLPLRMGAFLLGIGAVVALLIFLFPSAEILLDVPETTQELDMEIWASPEISSANISGGIPAYPISVTVEGRDDIRSTGTLSLPLVAAEGFVQFTNLTEEEIAVPAGTVVLTVGTPSVRFVTTGPVHLLSGVGKTVETSVQAILAGTSGNIEAGAITAIEGDLGLKLLVENLEAISGGTDQTEPAPNEADANALRSALLEHLRDTAMSELSTVVGPGQQILGESVVVQEILEETFEPGLDQPGDRLALTMRAVFSGLYYQQSDVESVVQLSLDANLAKHYMAIPDTFQIMEMDETGKDDPQQSHWQIQVIRKIKEVLPINSIKNQVAGKSPQAAIQLVNGNFNSELMPEIVVHPKWWPRLPYFFMRIKVVER